MTESSLRELWETRSVVICVGAGGVGKTSVAASLSVAAARQGKRVLALTVDPSLRLAESLGVSTRTDARQSIDRERSLKLGIEPGNLSVMMLDPARSWDELIARTAPNEELRQRVVRHPLYQVLMQYLAGAHEYMAMEKLLTVIEQEEHDLIVLDTPPSRHALDFLRAPDRLADAVDGPIIKGLAQAVEGGGRFSLKLISRSILLVVRSMSRLMGASMLEQLAGLIAELNRAFGGLRERAERVNASFREGNFAYVLVSRPNPSAVEDTLYFERELEKRGLTGDAIVVNNVETDNLTEATQEQRSHLEQLLGGERTARVLRALAEQRALVGAQARSLESLLRSSRVAERR